MSEMEHDAKTADYIRELEEENERLRVQYKGCDEERIAAQNRADEHWAKIEAALALAEYVVALADDSARTATDPRTHVAIGRAAERVVKALKGGK